MVSIFHNKMIACTSNFLSKCVITITTMVIQALKWTLTNVFQRDKARWVVRGFVEISDAHFNPDAAHAPDASDYSLLMMIYLMFKLDIIFRHLYVKKPFINSPLRTRYGYGYLLGTCIPLDTHLPSSESQCTA